MLMFVRHLLVCGSIVPLILTDSLLNGSDDISTPTAQGPSSPSPCSLAITIDSIQPASAPVVLKVTITNTSSHDLTDDFERCSAYAVSLHSGDRPIQSQLSNGWQLREKQPSTVTLKPGQSATVPLWLVPFQAGGHDYAPPGHTHLSPGGYQLHLSRLFLARRDRPPVPVTATNSADIVGPPTIQMQTRQTLSAIATAKFTVVDDDGLAKARLTELTRAFQEHPWFGKYVLSVEESKDRSWLELREIKPDLETTMEMLGTPIPHAALSVFSYEGQPLSARVGKQYIAVDCRYSGVLFDRKTGKVIRRLTLADGWPAERPSEFPLPLLQQTFGRRIGPGILPGEWFGGRRPTGTHDESVSIDFCGQIWRAMQPANFPQHLAEEASKQAHDSPQSRSSWTQVLEELNTACYLEATPHEGDGPTVRYTVADGLPSNIVTQLAAFDGRLWAACADIYEPATETWGPGGLCCFDPHTRRWQRIEEIDHQTARWITAMYGDDSALWVAFCTGKGLANDKPPMPYQPRERAVVLARLAGSTWKTFTCDPLTGKAIPKMDFQEGMAGEIRGIIPSGDKVLIEYETYSKPSGNWFAATNRNLLQLQPAIGVWKSVDPDTTFDGGKVEKVVAEDGEIMAVTNRGVYCWLSERQKWRLLDPESPIKNPVITTAVLVGDELWIGYTDEFLSPPSRSGISRFHDKTQKWSHVSAEEIGSAYPICGIVPMPKGEVWLLSGLSKPLVGPHSKQQLVQNVGRFHSGKWEFPVKLKGIAMTYSDSRSTTPAPIEHLTAVGEKLFASNATGLYVGPGQWKRIVEGPLWVVQPTQDGKALEMLQNRDRKRYYGRYDPATGEMKWSPTDTEHLSSKWYNFPLAGNFPVMPPQSSFAENWTGLSTIEAQRWRVGPLGVSADHMEPHKEVETPFAIWFVSKHELIRLDREVMREWMKSRQTSLAN